jgi:TP901 family phage tail tape measure protein
MGRTDYIVQAGIGFDLDRSSAKKSIGIFESLAGTLNTVASKKAKQGFDKTEKDYQASMKKVAEINKKADSDLISGVKASAKATQKALQASMPKKLTKAAKSKMKPGEIKAYEKAFKASMQGMSSSYGKFAKEAEKLGIKVSKAQGFGKGRSVQDFAKKDVETRTRLIKLTERMVKDEREQLKLRAKGSKAYKTQLASVQALEQQGKAMSNLNDDIIQQEKKTDKIKRKSAKAERKAENIKIRKQKEIVAGLKNVQRATAQLGKIATASAGKIAGGLKNAFVIGTAAAMAFFYKMQPLAATVQEFEKTIINANSVFNVTKQELFEVSDTMVRFTLKYGVASQEMAQGLYQLASAGLTAAESQMVLQNTMKLAMATQGDHNALAKLTVQVIMGFGMEMEDSAMLVDKFAHSIQKSLIEWEDLASSVKFAMPFFVATGQSIDELLGGLEVLTNRALEAGIAGRGLRQALAQFAKHADDNSSAMRKLGIEIMDTEGNMRALHEIAQDAAAAFGDVTDLEALTIMLEDMNVRGATAFALLVQNADEFESAVTNLGDSAGEATLMAEIQQQSLTNQIQLVKNALLAPFLFADEVGAANDTLNAFTLKIKELVQNFTEFFIVTLPDGTQALTQHSDAIKVFVIEALGEAVLIIRRLKEIFLESEDGLTSFTELLNMAVQPLHILLDIMEYLGPSSMAWIVKLKVLNSVLPITNGLYMVGTYLQMRWMARMIAGSKATTVATASLRRYTIVQWEANAIQTKSILSLTGSTFGLRLYNLGLVNVAKTTGIVTMSTRAMMLSMGLAVGLFIVATQVGKEMSAVLIGLAAVMAMVAFYGYMSWGAPKGPPGWAAAAAGTVAMFAGMMLFKNKLQSVFGDTGFGGGGGGGFNAGDWAGKSLPTERNYDSGGTFLGGARMYDMGGPTTEHGMAVLQKGETIIPKTRNMLEGGITLNIGGDIVTNDAEDFAERIAEVLPMALRRQADIGGI